MKKVLFAFASFAMLLGSMASCGGSDVQEKINKELKQEITILDSTTTVLEAEVQELKDASKELDNLLNEL